MTVRSAAQARRFARDILAYRAWFADPAGAPIPAIAVISDPRIHRRESERARRRLLGGAVTVAPAPHRTMHAAVAI